MSRMSLLHVRRVALTVLFAGTWGGAAFWHVTTVSAQDRKSVWNGVYASEQAARGKAAFEISCVGCHGTDLAGLAGPELAGDRFRNKWDFQPVSQLFTEMKTRMPRNNPATLNDETYLDLVTYILEANAFPPGNEALKLDTVTLAGIMIQKQKGGQPAELPTGALAQIVGCLSQEGANWMLTSATRPVRTDNPDASKADQRAALDKVPLGSARFQLLGVYGSIDSHKGHKMEAKGFLVRNASGDQVNIAALEMIGEGCTP